MKSNFYRRFLPLVNYLARSFAFDDRFYDVNFEDLKQELWLTAVKVMRDNPDASFNEVRKQMYYTVRRLTGRYYEPGLQKSVERNAVFNTDFSDCELTTFIFDIDDIINRIKIRALSIEDEATALAVEYLLRDMKQSMTEFLSKKKSRYKKSSVYNKLNSAREFIKNELCSMGVL